MTGPLKKDLEEFLSHLKRLNYSPGTIKKRKKDLSSFLRYPESRGVDHSLKITREHIVDHLVLVRERGVSSGTLSACFTAIRLFMNYLRETRGFLIDPLEGIEAPRQTGSLPGEILTLEEVERLIAGPNTGLVEGIRDRALLELLYSTGIRNNEVACLEAQDLDLISGRVFIREGKGKKDRLLPVGKQAVRWLKEYLVRVRTKFINRRQPDPGLFLAVTGDRLSGKWVTLTVKDYARRAGIKKKVTPHTFRHTMATHLLMGGAGIETVQHMLGHSNLSTTTIYTHLAPVDLKKVHGKTHPRR